MKSAPSTNPGPRPAQFLARRRSLLVGLLVLLALGAAGGAFALTPRNRLNLLHRIRAICSGVADLTKVDG